VRSLTHARAPSVAKSSGLPWLAPSARRLTRPAAPRSQPIALHADNDHPHTRKQEAWARYVPALPEQVPPARAHLRRRLVELPAPALADSQSCILSARKRQSVTASWFSARAQQVDAASASIAGRQHKHRLHLHRFSGGEMA
jgi:hypothetical protein